MLILYENVIQYYKIIVPTHNVFVLQVKSHATAKVCYLEVTRVCEQHVARLEVPVGQAVGV